MLLKGLDLSVGDQVGILPPFGEYLAHTSHVPHVSLLVYPSVMLLHNFSAVSNMLQCSNNLE